MQWEREYVRRGFRALSLHDFVENVYAGRALEPKLGRRRGEEEIPVRHAAFFEARELYRRPLSPVITKPLERKTEEAFTEISDVKKDTFLPSHNG
ncbi:hypothetical protein D6789_02040 [Candidatus Woesearchaeota archaeon]|nr:MAG: hypothetical protein D6789_02040 [Candidatus Woesearchaeota archaeon]